MCDRRLKQVIIIPYTAWQAHSQCDWWSGSLSSLWSSHSFDIADISDTASSTQRNLLKLHQWLLFICTSQLCDLQRTYNHSHVIWPYCSIVLQPWWITQRDLWTATFMGCTDCSKKAQTSLIPKPPNNKNCLVFWTVFPPTNKWNFLKSKSASWRMKQS